MLRSTLLILIDAQGPPGTGKTTSILCVARALLGPDYKQGVLELNASDDRSAQPPACALHILHMHAHLARARSGRLATRMRHAARIGSSHHVVLPSQWCASVVQT